MNCTKTTTAIVSDVTPACQHQHLATADLARTNRIKAALLYSLATFFAYAFASGLALRHHEVSAARSDADTRDANGDEIIYSMHLVMTS